MMGFSNTWDVEKYKSEFESDEQWQLRKKFMQAHKNKFPEDKLVCLARVFCNVEFLGCRYPEKTMNLVAELSKDVAGDYREKQKGKLKRTFVQASDAAGAKIKGTGAMSTSKLTEEPQEKTLKMSDSDPTSTGFKYTCFVHADLVKPPTMSQGEFPGFIIYENCKTNCPINILTQSSQKSKTWNVISFDFSTGKTLASNMERCCEITLNQKVLSSGVGSTTREAKVKAATEGLNKLRQYCYTIQEKLSFFSDGELVSKDQVVKGKEAPKPLPQDNIGSRMMMKMGWTGAGLGKNQQGIQTPIEASQTMHRTGFGHLSTPQFHAKFRKVFQDYIASGSSNDLVFAPDFSADERKILHKLAQNMNLKTKSHGKNEQRHLVVYKIMTLPEILETLLRCGGENEKYSLLHPQRDDSSNSSASSSHVVVDNISHDVCVKTVSTEVTKDNATHLEPRDNIQFLEPEDDIQCLEPEDDIQCLQAEDDIQCLQPGDDIPCPEVPMEISVETEQKSNGVEEIIILSSDDEQDVPGPSNVKWDVPGPSSVKWDVPGPSSLQWDVPGPSNVETQNGTNYQDFEENYVNDLDVINKVIEMKKDDLHRSVQIYNDFVRKYHAGTTLKEEDKLYFTHKKHIFRLCGISRMSVIGVKSFKLEDVLIDIDAITDLKHMNQKGETVNLLSFS